VKLSGAEGIRVGRERLLDPFHALLRPGVGLYPHTRHCRGFPWRTLTPPITVAVAHDRALLRFARAVACTGTCLADAAMRSHFKRASRRFFMSLRLGALLCLSGIAACSHHSSETAKDPSYVNEPASAATDPSMRPASLEPSTQATPAAKAEGDRDVQAPLVADTKGTSSGDFKDGNPARDGNAPKDGNPPSSAATAPSRADAASPTTQPDNTKVNERDRNDTLTPVDQNNNQTDLKITQQIRQAVMGDGSLSFTAKNVKIITQNGKVTLRGPVKTVEERNAIEAAARKVAGATQVDNQIEVKK
jgi:osmotically-inducible protein OsmY